MFRVRREFLRFGFASNIFFIECLFAWRALFGYFFYSSDKILSSQRKIPIFRKNLTKKSYFKNFLNFSCTSIPQAKSHKLSPKTNEKMANYYLKTGFYQP